MYEEWFIFSLYHSDDIIHSSIYGMAQFKIRMFLHKYYVF